MQCHDARMLLGFGFKPAELSAEDVAELDHHLQECSSCRVRSENERRLDATISRAMAVVAIPAGAQQRLVQELRKRTQMRRRWVGAAAAVAAAILVSVGLGGYLWVNQPLVIDLKALYAELKSRSEVRKKPEEVRKWFENHDAPIQVPTRLVSTRAERYELEYFHLQMVGFEKLQGVEVPHLLFQRDNDSLHVYVLSDQQFDLTAIKPEPGYAGPFTVEVLTGSSGNERYLCAYTSNSLRDFCTRPSQSN